MAPPLELIIFDCDGMLVDSERLAVKIDVEVGMLALGYAGGLTPADRLCGPGTIVFHDMRKLPELLAR